MANVKLSAGLDEDLLHKLKWVCGGTGRTYAAFLNEAVERQIRWEEENIPRPWVDPTDRTRARTLEPGDPYPEPPGRKLTLPSGRPPETF